ncbi:MAG: toxin glutamine deamidase domain-containing protein [Acidimicrobiia bacterium]
MKRLGVGVFVVLAAALIVVGLPLPARADNCAGLSDCSLGMTIALAILAVALVVALLMLGWAIAVDLGFLGMAEGLAAGEESMALWELMEGAASGANPSGCLTNCSKVVQVMTTRLTTGSEVFAGEGIQGTSLYGLAENMGGSLSEAMSSAGVESAMASAPEGGQGIVYVWSEGSGASHVFNGLKQGGMVIYGDGQTGAVGWTAAEVATESGYTGSDLVWYLISLW